MKNAVSKKMVLKWVGFACLIVGIGYGVRAMSDVHNDVHLVYRVNDAPMRVLIRDAEGTKLRQTEFSGPPFEHDVVLPVGTYEAVITQSGHTFRPVSFRVEGDGPVVIGLPKTAPAPDTSEGRPPE